MYYYNVCPPFHKSLFFNKPSFQKSYLLVFNQSFYKSVFIIEKNSPAKWKSSPLLIILRIAPSLHHPPPLILSCHTHGTLLEFQTFQPSKWFPQLIISINPPAHVNDDGDNVSGSNVEIDRPIQYSKELLNPYIPYYV